MLWYADFLTECTSWHDIMPRLLTASRCCAGACTSPRWRSACKQQTLTASLPLDLCGTSDSFSLGAMCAEDSCTFSCHIAQLVSPGQVQRSLACNEYSRSAAPTAQRAEYMGGCIMSCSMSASAFLHRVSLLQQKRCCPCFFRCCYPMMSSIAGNVRSHAEKARRRG